MWFQKAQETSKAAAAKKKPAAAARPWGAPRRDCRWGGEHGIVESGGVSHSRSHSVGASVPGVLDAGGEHEDDGPAKKKPDVYRSFQKATWLLLPRWLLLLSRRCWVPRLCRLPQDVMLAVYVALGGIVRKL